VHVAIFEETAAMAVAIQLLKVMRRQAHSILNILSLRRAASFVLVVAARATR